MNIIYLGLMFCEESLKDEVRMKSRKIAMAPHKFQTNVIRGLESQAQVDLSVINVPPTGSFPINSRRLVSGTYRWGNSYRQIGYINLPWIKHRLQTSQLYRLVRQRIQKEKTTCLMLYSLYEPFLKVAQRIKKAYPDIHVCLIQTDAVPGRDDMEKYMTAEAKKRGDKAVAMARSFDSFILLAKDLAVPLEIGDRPYLIAECVCDEKQKAADACGSVPGTFLYTGGVSKAFGLCELVEAFKALPNLQLWICGDGDARNEIEEASRQYSNIQYFGFVSQDKIRQLQDSCAFLINPRRPSGTYTKYSFPSKTAEYMMTAKPVVMYKLEAIPDEYDGYLNYLTGTTPERIAEELQKISDCTYSQLLKKACDARTYMLNNKTAEITGSKIVRFLRGLKTENE